MDAILCAGPTVLGEQFPGLGEIGRRRQRMHVECVELMGIIVDVVDLQMVTYFKWIVHVVIAILIGVMYSDCGSNASKSIQNLSLLCATNLYFFYTALLPSVLKCEYLIFLFSKSSISFSIS